MNIANHSESSFTTWVAISLGSTAAAFGLFMLLSLYLRKFLR